MALTQAQKNIITTVSVEPEKILSDFKDNPHLVQSFKGEFFQDGTGLLDKVLYMFLITNSPIYFEIFQFINQNSSINIFERKGNKQNAFERIMDINEPLPELHTNIFKILIENKQLENFPTYLIEKHIVNLYITNQKTNAEEILNKYTKNYNYFQNIFYQVLLNDDVDFFKILLKNEQFKNNMNELNYYDSTESKSSKINKKLFGNALYFCLTNRKHQLTEYFLDNNFFSLTNSRKNDSYNQKITSANILNTLTSNNLLFEKIIEKFKTNDLIEQLLGQSSNYNLDAYTVLTRFLNEKESSYLKEKTLFLLKKCKENYNKTKLFYSIFNSTISYDDKLFFLQNGMDKTINEKYSYTSVFNCFILDIQKNPIISTELFNSFIIEFKNRDLISEDSIYKDCYFLDVDYFKLINQNQTLKYNNPLKFAQQALKQLPALSLYLNQETNGKKDDINYIWTVLSECDYPIQDFSETNNPIQFLLNHNLDRIANLFSSEHLKKLFNNKPFINISNLNKNENSTDFFKIIEKIHTSMDFSENSHLLKKLISFNPPNYLLDEIVEYHRIPLDKIFKEKNFLSSVRCQRIFNHLKDKNMQIYKDDLFLLCMNYDTVSLEIYLKNGGEISCTDNQDNILHQLCNFPGEIRKNEILLLLDYYPDLASQTNKQGKYPISYLVVDFNKICKNYLTIQTSSNRFREAVNNYYDVVEAMLICGLESNNKKAFKTIESQLQKYESIQTLFPELLPMLRSGNLTKKLEVKKIKSSNIKI